VPDSLPEHITAPTIKILAFRPKASAMASGGISAYELIMSTGDELTMPSRAVTGILLMVLPTVIYGGVSILSLLIGEPAYTANKLRQDL
jgi:hypothetical protein